MRRLISLSLRNIEMVLGTRRARYNLRTTQRERRGETNHQVYFPWCTNARNTFIIVTVLSSEGPTEQEERTGPSLVQQIPYKPATLGTERYFIIFTVLSFISLIYHILMMVGDLDEVDKIKEDLVCNG